MLQEYLKTHTVDDLKAFFAKSHIKPFAFNSIENINFCTPEEWEKLVELFTFGCKVAQQIGNPYLIVVPTVTNEICTKNEKEIFDDRRQEVVRQQRASGARDRKRRKS